ncbi:MAG: tyrosine--tRNA ligase, partial [Nanoarchaeota archaeon]
MNTLTPEEVERRITYLSRGVEQIIEREELAWKIEKSHREGRSLIVKLGVDPTSPDLHLGHTVPFMKLKHFQDLGYEVQFLIGDFTGRIGDPSGRSASRKPLSEEEVLSNAEQYKRQIFKILDPELTKMVYNSSWLNALKPDDFIRLMGKGTVNDQIKRRGVANRLEEGNPVSVAEFVYPF